MGEALYRGEAAYREAVDRVAEGICRTISVTTFGISCSETVGSEINRDEANAQPALFVTEYALACLWRQWGIVPKAMIGHSIGEYVAAHLAERRRPRGCARHRGDPGPFDAGLPPGGDGGGPPVAGGTCRPAAEGHRNRLR